MLFKLGNNIGYVIEGVYGLKADDDFNDKKKEAWEFCRNAIERDLPCFGFDLAGPEYFVVNGYNDEGYFFSGGASAFQMKKPKKWEELGDTVGLLEMHSIRSGRAADDAQSLKESMEFVLEQSGSDQSGLKGFDNWINALEAGTASTVGTALNAGCWSECRAFGVQFLKEAKDRIGSNGNSLFDEAVVHYEEERDYLQKISELFPIHLNYSNEPIKNADLSQKAVEHLRKARKAEEAGLDTLKKILDKL
jgi:hypothetical protein